MTYLGIDGGGSGCRARLVDEAGQVLGEGWAGPANIASDFAGALANIRSAAQMAYGGRVAPETIRAVAGIAGANLSGAGPELAAQLPFPVRVVQDIAISVRGALGPGDGIVAALGTGSIFARQREGQVRSVGGWGLRIGDEASGAWIGRAVVMRAARMIDGFIAPTPLLARIAGELGGAPGIVQFSLRANPADYAGFVPRILEAEAEGDEAAGAILAAARSEIRAAIRLLQPRDTVLPVVWTGGLGPALALEDWPRAEAAGDALAGAIEMARGTEWTA